MVDHGVNRTRPKVVAPNIYNDPEIMKQFAADNGFDGIDWSFDLERLPETPVDESRWAKRQAKMAPFEVRYHCPFLKVDIGHEDRESQAKAMDIFRRMIRLTSKAHRKYLSLHVGLGHNTTKILSWEATINNLRDLVLFGVSSDVTVCLENLIWGWTSKPNLFEKLVRKSGAAVTFDIGHASSCEAIESQSFEEKDFVTPHADKVCNAHIYHKEVAGVGHFPPETVDDISGRLDILKRTSCDWWVVELKNADDLIKTKTIIDEYLRRSEAGEMTAAKDAI